MVRAECVCIVLHTYQWQRKVHVRPAWQLQLPAPTASLVRVLDAGAATGSLGPAQDTDTIPIMVDASLAPEAAVPYTLFLNVSVASQLAARTPPARPTGHPPADPLTDRLTIARPTPDRRPTSA